MSTQFTEKIDQQWIVISHTVIIGNFVILKYIEMSNISHIFDSRYPKKFLSEISMQGDQFWNDVTALVITMIILRVACYYALKGKVMAVR